ncbi:helicase RepA family protein [Vibrio taketomensis]|uniref:helicase RepA family protein n=1 Tax=Vibrio taketomensis TaxID=2572923 RepID=UPI00138A3F2D|nr:helicase RepA family protein [Vibrio taketomensis]
MTVTEYNRSLVGLFEPKREQLDSFVVKSGSQGWDEEVQWIVENQFQANSLNMVYGPSGSFKSFHATDLAACVVTGTPWGTSGVTQGNVIYIAAEGDVGLSKRIKAWELINGQETHNLFRIGQPLALTQSNDFEQLLKVIDFTCRKHGDIKMIVIDTLARCFGNGDENSAKDMGAFIAACDRLKQHTQAAILLVHHTGKDATRGSWQLITQSCIRY